MPATGKKYPEWVQRQRARGTTVKKKGDNYYLYKRTSRRVPGKKYPQPVDTYIGIITENGVVRSHRRRVKVTGIEVWEYGFSRAAWDLCPEGWKKPLGGEWEDVLARIIVRQSPASYLARDRKIRDEQDFRCSFGAQTGLLSRRMHREHGIGLEDLKAMAGIFLVYLDGEPFVSRVSDSQREFADIHGISLDAL